MNYIFHYDIAAIIITLTIMVHFFSKKNINTQLTRIFSALMVVTFLAGTFDIIDCYTTVYAARLPRVIPFVFKNLYLLTINLISPLYYAYIVFSVKSEEELSISEWIKIVTPFSMEVILLILNPFTGVLYKFDAQMRYSFGPFMLASHIFALFYIIAAIQTSFIGRKKLTKTQQAAVAFFTTSTFAAILIQSMHSYLLVEVFSVSITIVLIYLSMENPDAYEDQLLGTYNRAAFVRILQSRIKTQNAFPVIGITVHGFKYINDSVGVENGDRMLKQIADTFMQIAPGIKVFHLTSVRFAILIESRQSAEDIVDKIKSRFSMPFRANGVEMNLSTTLCTVYYPENAKSIEDIIDTVEYALKEANAKEDSVVVDNIPELLMKKRREREILQLLKKPDIFKHYEVYYQPIYSVEEEKYTSAEALLRLSDSFLGFISPEEFIPIAEKNGLILDIGKWVVATVCKFIVEEKVWENGIKYVEINLSTVQCMRENLYQELLEIIDGYQVPHVMINLEITESAAASNNELLLCNMNKMIEQGISFSMDDYGTGFSNTSHVIEYPFEIVKFDKSLVWAAMENEKALCTLKHNTAMIKEMKMHIVAEGVETQQQANILKELGCDYFQGFYYSRPVPKKLFLEKIREQK